MATYRLTIEMPWRPISLALQADNDGHALRTATDMVLATCAEIDGLGEYRTRLFRADGTEVIEPVSIALLVARS